MPCPVYIGIAGWSYPDWKEIVYPDSKTDQLKYVSGFVDCIEINSTFYRPPSEKTTKSWLQRTAEKEDFFFTAKLHREFTHEGKLNPRTIRDFHKGFEPMIKANKLKHLLAQFRYDFNDTAENRERLKKIICSFSCPFNLAVELRHKSWENPQALDFLEQKGITVCNLDYPTTYNSFDIQHCTVGTNGYFRLHGRNADKWFSKAGRDETYNYYYSKRELSDIQSRINALAKACQTLTVIMNNHYRGAELANALELKCLISGDNVNLPTGLLKTYPCLKGIANC
ncbi:MAG: DUF72 domain-containing protein [Sedimentisphaerales bacterium]|nr:DUF72 domain-containing protein [Sedimentisphaerales bacterium]